MFSTIKLLVRTHTYATTNTWHTSPAIIGDCLHAVIKITKISKELYPNVKLIIKSMKIRDMHVHYSILLIHWTFVVEQFPKLLYDLKKRVAWKTNLEAGDYRDNRSFVRLDRTNRNIPLGNLTKQTQTSVQRTTQRCYITDVL